MPFAAWCTSGARDSKLNSDSANAGAAISVELHPGVGVSVPGMRVTRHTRPVDIDVGTMALAELAAAHVGMPVSEWIARAVRREFVAIEPGPNHRPPTDAEMPAQDLERAGCSCPWA